MRSRRHGSRADALGEFFGERANRSQAVLDRGDQSRADDDGIGVCRDFGSLCAGANSQSDATGMSECARIRAVSSGAIEDTASRAPVTPIVEAA